MPQSASYPKSLRTIGDHLRKRRLDLKLLQKAVAKILEVDPMTVCNWENNLTQPKLHFLPRIIRLIGYDPFSPKSNAVSEMLLLYRKSSGIAQKKLALQIGIDPTTLSRVEREQGICTGSTQAKIRAFLTGRVLGG